MSIRDDAIALAFCYLGDPYEWGGDGEGGHGGNNYDCSGFILHILQQTGIFPPELDMTAQNIYNAYKSYTTEKPYKACVAFYGDSVVSITHCALIINSRGIIGANGGNIGKVSAEKIDFHNKKMIAIVDPYKKIGEQNGL